MRETLPTKHEYTCLQGLVDFFQSEESSMFEDLEALRKINIVGTSGCGKTTFAQCLSEILNIPFIEMDQLFWGPDWEMANDGELFSRLKLELSKPSWILDGNYTRTIPVKWAAVDAVIWLDLPFLTTVTRVIRRAIGRIVSKEELWPGTGNKETIRSCFCSKDSVILWSISTYAKNRRKYLSLMHDKKYSNIEFIRLRSSLEVQRFLERLRNAT